MVFPFSVNNNVSPGKKRGFERFKRRTDPKLAQRDGRRQAPDVTGDAVVFFDGRQPEDRGFDLRGVDFINYGSRLGLHPALRAAVLMLNRFAVLPPVAAVRAGPSSPVQQALLNSRFRVKNVSQCPDNLRKIAILSLTTES